jgi:putative membrane protein
MSPAAMTWIKAFHLFGVFMWMGTMIGASHILVAHAEADLGSRPAFHGLERRLAIAMDVGATIAIVFGVILLVKTPGIMKVGSMHAKLALVVALLGVHGLLRAKIRKHREGKVVPLAGAVPGLLPLISLAIIVLVVVKPF